MTGARLIVIVRACLLAGTLGNIFETQSWQQMLINRLSGAMQMLLFNAFGDFVIWHGENTGILAQLSD